MNDPFITLDLANEAVRHLRLELDLKNREVAKLREMVGKLLTMTRGPSAADMLILREAIALVGDDETPKPTGIHVTNHTDEPVLVTVSKMQSIPEDSPHEP
jgi:hypothetical protein